MVSLLGTYTIYECGICADIRSQKCAELSVQLEEMQCYIVLPRYLLILDLYERMQSTNNYC